jgi:hypothetical protein
MYHIPTTTFERWRKAIPELEQAFKDMKDTIHVRRRIMWGDRNLVENNFLRYAHQYRAEEALLDKYHADLKKASSHEPPKAIQYEAVPVKETGKFTYKEEADAEQT